MPHKKNIRKKRSAPGGDDKVFMIETLLFILLMVVCAGAIVFVLCRLVIRLSESVTVAPS